MLDFPKFVRLGRMEKRGETGLETEVDYRKKVKEIPWDKGDLSRRTEKVGPVWSGSIESS